MTRLGNSKVGKRENSRPKPLFIDFYLISYALQVWVQLDAVAKPHHARDAREQSKSEHEDEPQLFLERHL